MTIQDMDIEIEQPSDLEWKIKDKNFEEVKKPKKKKIKISRIQKSHCPDMKFHCSEIHRFTWKKNCSRKSLITAT